MTNRRAYEMMFKDVEILTGKAYWLASSGVREGSGYAYFGPGGVNSPKKTLPVQGLISAYFVLTGISILPGLAVRPVVVLKSDVMATEVPKIADQASTWTYSAKSE